MTDETLGRRSINPTRIFLRRKKPFPRVQCPRLLKRVMLSPEIVARQPLKDLPAFGTPTFGSKKIGILTRDERDAKEVSRYFKTQSKLKSPFISLDTGEQSGVFVLLERPFKSFEPLGL